MSTITHENRDRFEAFIKTKALPESIADLQETYLDVLLEVCGPARAIPLALQLRFFMESIGASGTPLRDAFNAYLAALDTFDTTTRAEFYAAEAYRESMLADTES